MLLPSLKKATGKAREVSCLNNYRNLGMQNHYFADDFDGRSVSSGGNICESNGAVEFPDIWNWMYYDNEGKIHNMTAWSGDMIGCSELSYINAHPGATIDITRSMGINFHLWGGPNWLGPPTTYGKVITDQSQWPGPPFGGGTPSYMLGAKLSKVKRASEFFMFSDIHSTAGVGLNPEFSSLAVFNSKIATVEGQYVIDKYVFRHGDQDRSTTVFVDGHAELLSPEYENFTRDKMYFDYQ